MTHLILTRFNMQFEADMHVGIERAWLNERFMFFEQYCLPSVQKQTVQDFTWILLCDISTPAWGKERLESYRLRLPQIVIEYVPWVEDPNVLYQQIGLRYAKNGELLLSTRLDNDDALELTYVERVQPIAEEMRDGIISFAEGRQTFVRDHRSFSVRYVQNHFTSRVESSGYFTALGFDHTRLYDVTSAVRIVPSEEPMWEEIVHGGNIANGYDPHFRYSVRSVSDVTYLFCRWCAYQWQRVERLFKRLFVSAHKR